MDPFKDLQTILAWIEQQGNVTWLSAALALADFIQFVLRQIPQPSPGMRMMGGERPAYAALSLNSLGERLKEEAAAYKANPSQYGNWENLLALLLAILKYAIG